MQDWDPDLYRQFEAERTRPATDLLAHITITSPQFISDLGCGPGNSTELLHRRFPDAQLVGIDHSQAMLASAQQRLPHCTFVEADIHQWHPSQPQNLIYANASLQWLTDHPHLFPSLLSQLAPKGCWRFRCRIIWINPVIELCGKWPKTAHGNKPYKKPAQHGRKCSRPITIMIYWLPTLSESIFGVQPITTRCHQRKQLLTGCGQRSYALILNH